jgi:hypothetical protein
VAIVVEFVSVSVQSVVRFFANGSENNSATFNGILVDSDANTRLIGLDTTSGVYYEGFIWSFCVYT